MKLNLFKKTKKTKSETAYGLLNIRHGYLHFFFNGDGRKAIYCSRRAAEEKLEKYGDRFKIVKVLINY